MKGYNAPDGMRADQMKCPECEGTAECDSVDVGVGLYIAGNFWCECGWEITADGKANVATYDDWFPDQGCPEQQDGRWVSIGYTDPPPAPPGFETEVQRDGFLGIVTAYRFVPVN